jgi:hypothetical protein
VSSSSTGKVSRIPDECRRIFLFILRNANDRNALVSMRLIEPLEEGKAYWQVGQEILKNAATTGP